MWNGGGSRQASRAPLDFKMMQVSSGSGIPTELAGSSSWSQECRVWLHREQYPSNACHSGFDCQLLLVGKCSGVVLPNVWWDMKWHDCLWLSLPGSLQAQKFKWWQKVHFQELILFLSNSCQRSTGIIWLQPLRRARPVRIQSVLSILPEIFFFLPRKFLTWKSELPGSVFFFFFFFSTFSVRGCLF